MNEHKLLNGIGSLGKKNIQNSKISMMSKVYIDFYKSLTLMNLFYFSVKILQVKWF